MTVSKNDIQHKLEAELDRLKRVLRLGYELRAKWVPSNNSKISGEVKNGTIFVYDGIEEVALETLKHEFLDYCVSGIVEPYKEVANKLIAIINDACYKDKERLVEALSRLL